MTDLQTHLRDKLAPLLGDLPEGTPILLQPPKDRRHGDLALACFPLAKARGVPPPQVASDIAERFAIDDVVAEAVAAGPFVNFRFWRAALARTIVTGVLGDAPPYGPAAETGKTVVVDYSSPNIAKPFHMGHLRSTVIGMAIVRINRHVGHTVHGINHLGDWGMPFAKMMTAWMRFGDQSKLADQPMRHMFELYKLYGEKAKEDPTLDEDAARHFRALESGEDNEERRMWTFLRDESLKAFQGPYDRLGVTFDHVTGESFYEDKMAAAMQRVEQAGVLETSQGAEVVRLEDQGIKQPCLLRKSDGTTLYHTRDLAAVSYRQESFRPDRMLYVVGSEQKLHFRQLKGVLAKIGDPIADRIEHVPFGLILARNEETGKLEKLASRGGNAIFLDEMLDEAVAKVRTVIADKNPDLEDADQIAEEVGVSSIVFNDLKNSRIKDVKFDFDAMTSFDGETGPYVQYAVARLASILRKADCQAVALDAVDWTQLEDAEDVLLSMLEFGPTVDRAARDSEPSAITNLVIDVAGRIHSYLKDHHVLRAGEPQRTARLALVLAARRLLKTGLGLIGVRAPDRM